MKIEPLYLTEAQIAERLGISTEDWACAAPMLEKYGFPKPEHLFAGRRYWPACKAFLDRRYDLGTQSGQGIPALDGVERWNEPKSNSRRRA